MASHDIPCMQGKGSVNGGHKDVSSTQRQGALTKAREKLAAAEQVYDEIMVARDAAQRMLTARHDSFATSQVSRMESCLATSQVSRMASCLAASKVSNI